MDMVRIATYNIEQFHELFTNTNQLRNDADSTARFGALHRVLDLVDADLIGITEAPSHTASGAQSTVTKLENFAAAAPGGGLRTSSAVFGYNSNGSQEIAVVYDPTVVTVAQ
jgi:hypothetical protein